MPDPINPLTPTPTIEIAGKTYQLSYKRGDLVNADFKLRKTFIGDVQNVGEAPVVVDVLLFTGLQRAIPDLTFQQAQDMVTIENQDYIIKTCNAAFQEFQGEKKPETDEEGPDAVTPPLPETNGGIVPGPSASTTSG